MFLASTLRGIHAGTVLTLLLLNSAGLVESAEVRGRVWVQHSSQPEEYVTNGSVQLTDLGTSKNIAIQSDSEGRFLFPNVKTGIYVLRVSAPGYATTVVFPLMLTVSTEVRYASVMLPLGTREVGGQRDYPNGLSPTIGIVVARRKMASGAHVCFESLGKPRPTNCVTTNSLGVYETILFGGKYRIRVTLSDGTLHSEEATMVGGGESILNILLK